MKKSYWIFFSFAFMLLSLFLLFNLYKIQRKVSSSNDFIRQLDLKTNCKFFLFTVLWRETCDFGLSDYYIETINSLNFGKRLCVYYILPEKVRGSIQVRKNIPEEKVIVDRNNVILKKAGYFLPSILITDRKGNILFISPIFSDEQLQRNLLTSAIKTISTTLRLSPEN